MKFKYMLRGLGIGVIVTAAVMGAYSRVAVADAKAQARVEVLKEYGFGEEPTLVENETQTQQSETETAETIPIIVRDEVKESEIESVIESAKAAETENAEIAEGLQDSEPESESESESLNLDFTIEATKVEESKSESEQESKSEEPKVPEHIDASDVVLVPDTIDITISSGDDSGKVSRKLYNAGIVDSASEFDAFLTQHGYDKRIRVGTKTIDVNDTWQEIADKLTGN